MRTWQTPSAVKAAVASQSSWSKGSSMVTMGYSLQKPVYISFSFSLRTSELCLRLTVQARKASSSSGPLAQVLQAPLGLGI